MSLDMSHWGCWLLVSGRREQILKVALEIIATQGYGSLTMRAVARGSGLKLGALQYHFPAWESLLRSLAEYVASEYSQSLDSLVRAKNYSPTLADVLRWYLQDSGGDHLRSDLLWPQLWAMARVEPVMRESLDEIFKKVVALFESHLTLAGSQSPRLEALALLSLGEGAILFTGRGSPWEAEAEPLSEAVLQFIERRHGSRKLEGHPMQVETNGEDSI